MVNFKYEYNFLILFILNGKKFLMTHIQNKIKTKYFKYKFFVFFQKILEQEKQFRKMHNCLKKLKKVN